MRVKVRILTDESAVLQILKRQVAVQDAQIAVLKEPSRILSRFSASMKWSHIALRTDINSACADHY